MLHTVDAILNSLRGTNDQPDILFEATVNTPIWTDSKVHSDRLSILIRKAFRPLPLYSIDVPFVRLTNSRDQVLLTLRSPVSQ